jgi:hypothetical protein
VRTVRHDPSGSVVAQAKVDTGGPTLPRRFPGRIAQHTVAPECETDRSKLFLSALPRLRLQIGRSKHPCVRAAIIAEVY